MNDQQIDNAVVLYERLREKAENNVVATGVESLSFDLCEWRIKDNPCHNSKDILVTVDVSGERETFTIRFDAIKLLCDRFETNTIKKSRELSEHIRAKVAEHIAGRIGDRIFQECATALVRLK